MEGRNDGSIETTSLLQKSISSVCSIGEEYSAVMEEAEEQCPIWIQTLSVRTGLPEFVMTMKNDDRQKQNRKMKKTWKQNQAIISSSSKTSTSAAAI